METLTQLRLCRMPRFDQPFFWEDVEKIAGRFAVEAESLAEIVRHGQGLRRLRTAGAPSPQGGLMAARDRPPLKSDAPDKGEPT
jgi:hypothetical protein